MSQIPSMLQFLPTLQSCYSKCFIHGNYITKLFVLGIAEAAFPESLATHSDKVWTAQGACPSSSSSSSWHEDLTDVMFCGEAGLQRVPLMVTASKLQGSCDMGSDLLPFPAISDCGGGCFLTSGPQLMWNNLKISGGPFSTFTHPPFPKTSYKSRSLY